MHVVIVEDQAILRDLLQVYVAQDATATVRATGSGVEAVELVCSGGTELVFLDLHLPDIPGLEVHARVLRRRRGIRFLALSGYADRGTVEEVRRAGVHGFIDKATLGIATLEEAVRCVLAGGEYFRAASDLAPAAGRAAPPCRKVLSNRELEVLALIGRASSDGEISAALGISERTAQTHRSNILRKLSIAGTPKLIRFAQLHGLDGELQRPA